MLIPDPPKGPVGYELYTLEPLFYQAIRGNQVEIVNFFLRHVIRLCNFAVEEAIAAQISVDIFQTFLDHK